MKQKILYLVLIVAVLVTCFVGSPTYQVGARLMSANVTDIEYSDVLVDLELDDNFNRDNYVRNDEDGSLSVMTIAKGVDNEMFVYVYQPACGFNGTVATSINISTNEHSQDKDFHNYNLTLISHNGVFLKYAVDDLVVDESSCYEVSSIFRKYVVQYDKGISNNVISEVSFAVGKLYSFVDGNLNVEDVDYITITDKYVGYVRYMADSPYFNPDVDYVDSHFVAFSTDRQIDKLLEADVYFKRQRVKITHSDVSLQGESVVWLDDEPIEDYSYMTESSDVTYTGKSGFWHYTYNWDRIQSIDEFLASEDFSISYRGALVTETVEYVMTDDDKVNLQNMKWVLRFYESERNDDSLWGSVYYTKTMTRVTDVSILRLKFETAGVVYDLGVVDTKQTGSEEPSNFIENITHEINDEIKDKLKMIFGILLLIIVAVICAPLIPVVLNFAIFAIKTVFGIIGKFFKLIKNLFKRGN